MLSLSFGVFDMAADEALAATPAAAAKSIKQNPPQPSRSFLTSIAHAELT
jgi:hypothetical protein